MGFRVCFMLREWRIYTLDVGEINSWSTVELFRSLDQNRSFSGYRGIYSLLLDGVLCTW
jgi:hypothetical protein